MEFYNENPQEENDDLFEHHRIVADRGQSLIRIDVFLKERIANATRNKIQHGIKDGFVKVNGNDIKSNYKVRPGDVIIVSFPEPPRDTEVIPQDIPLDIVYEDASILIVNKPPGMVVHPAYSNWTGTLVNGLVYHFQQLPEMAGNTGRPGLVHRIDKDTSGLLVVAKNENALIRLAKQFFDHSIERTYQALVWGVPVQAEGTIDVNLGRSSRDRKIMAAYTDSDTGKNAITHYRLLKDLRYVSLIECRLETGRTHQIRAHMKHIGHPIFNDAAYGGDKILKGTIFTKYRSFVQNCFKLIPRQALHAKTIGFKHPDSRQFISFDSKLPEDMQAVIEKWEHYIHYN